MYAWARDLFLHQDFIRELKLTEKTIVDWCNCHRNICTDHFNRHLILLKDPGSFVEIVETCFGKESTTWAAVSQKWVFDGYDVTNKKGFLVQVNNRSKRTIKVLIQQYIHPASLIVTDGWASYADLNDLYYNHI